MDELVSDAERQRASERLQVACVDGYLNLDEFSQRVERTFSARTRSDLRAVLADLPTALAPSAHRVSSSGRTMVVLSGVDRSGSWRVPEQASIAVVLGSCKLDLRRATISARVTTIEARVVLGSLELIVPGGLDVDVEAVTFASSKSVRLSGPPARPDAPRIVVRGTVVCGSLTVHDVSHPIYELA